MKKTLAYLHEKKHRGQRIAVLTCYDHPTAVLLDEAGVDVILVGDSVGTNVLGYASEREVTMTDMVHHLSAVKRGVRDAHLLADLPFGTCDSPDSALSNARQLQSHGADGVKVEGFKVPIIQHLAEHGIEVCAHLGLNPQLDDKKALHARTSEAAIQLIQQALALEQAGAALIVLELIPEEVGRLASAALAIPTIGIAAGRYTDGQVLVINDMLGLNRFDLRHVRKYDDIGVRVAQAVRQYVQDVEAGRFPAQENVRSMATEELQALQTWASEHLTSRWEQ